VRGLGNLNCRERRYLLFSSQKRENLSQEAVSDFLGAGLGLGLGLGL